MSNFRQNSQEYSIKLLSGFSTLKVDDVQNISIEFSDTFLHPYQSISPDSPKKSANMILNYQNGESFHEKNCQNSGNTNFESKFSINSEQKLINSPEYNLGIQSLDKISHKCECMGGCIYCFCPCSNNISQECVEGECCENCVTRKKILKENQCRICKDGENDEANCKCIKNKRACDQNFCFYKKLLEITKKKKIRKHQLKKGKVDTTFRVCLCKKSLCSKKYCECFASGVPCNARCQCKGCLNEIQNYTPQKLDENEYLKQGASSSEKRSDMHEISEQSIGQYVQDNNFENMQMPQSMQFTNIDFKGVKQNS